MRTVWVLVGIGGIMLIALGTYAAKSLVAEPSASSAAIDAWRERIQTLGAEAAYDELICKYAGEPENVGHNEGHQFGAALYQEKGLSGITVCDDRFLYACLHEFVGRAIAEGGLRMAPKLREYCDGNPESTCHHGIGHGILASIGYAREDMRTAVALCDEVATGEGAGACKSGVFMEYTNRTMLGTDAGILPVSEHAMYAPCDGLTGADMQLCAFELPRLWRRTFWQSAPTSTIAVTKTGRMCEGLDGMAREGCFAGIGNDAFFLSRSNTEKAVALCDAYSAEPSLRDTCKRQVGFLSSMVRDEEPRCNVSRAQSHTDVSHRSPQQGYSNNRGDAYTVGTLQGVI